MNRHILYMLCLSALLMLGSVAYATEIGSTNITPSSAVGASQKPTADQRDVPTLARVYSSTNATLSGFCHILLFYGLGPTDLSSCPSGEFALKALTDEETAIKTFGKSPFILTRNGVRYALYDDPVFHSKIGEDHRDQCLATFAEMNLALTTPIYVMNKPLTISDLLSESLANFTLEQREVAWSAIAYAKYQSPKREWITRFGERISFSQLVLHLLQVNINNQSCAGTHVLIALLNIDRADRLFAILDNSTRERLHSYLASIIGDIVHSQQKDGGWTWRWCSLITQNEKRTTSLQDRILVTGHLLEVISLIDELRRPSPETYMNAAKWVKEALKSPSISSDTSLICPITHAARTARDILRLQVIK